MPAINWTDEEIEELAEIDREDQDEARDWWREVALVGFVTLIDAQPEPQTDAERKRLAALGIAFFFWWQRRRDRYISRRTGRTVSTQQLRRAVDGAVQNGAKRMRDLTNNLREGRLTLAQWQTRMAREIKLNHLSNGSVARGGLAQLTQADLDRISQRVAGQETFLRRFARQIEDGEQLLDGTALRRADMYAQAGRNTYHQLQELNMIESGFNEVRSILNAQESCSDSSRPGCIEEAARGFVPIGELTPLGRRTCLSNDRCSLEYRNAETGETRLVA